MNPAVLSEVFCQGMSGLDLSIKMYSFENKRSKNVLLKLFSKLDYSITSLYSDFFSRFKNGRRSKI